jgi:N-acetyl-anhydromuramyl-L-alanine amidase AmpD
VGTGWLARWDGRPLGVTWHWGATTSLASLSATLGGADASRKGEASAHYGVGRSYAEGVHRYVLLENRSWHAGKSQVTRWDGQPLTEADEKATRTTVGVEADHRGHVPDTRSAPADWLAVADNLGGALRVQPWTEEQLEMLVEVGKEIQAAWPHLGPRDHHGHSDLCPGYKTDVTGFPFARLLRAIYGEPDLPDVWSPFRTVRGRQDALHRLGYDLGPAGVDGIWGSDSREALRRFKLDVGLAPREREGAPVGGYWTTFVGWALFDQFAARGLPWVERS